MFVFLCHVTEQVCSACCDCSYSFVYVAVCFIFTTQMGGLSPGVIVIIVMGKKNMERFTNLRVVLAQGPC